MEKILQEAEKLSAHAGLMLIAILAGTSRAIMTNEPRTIGGYISSIIVAGFVGFIASELMKDAAFGEGTKGAIVGVSAFVANDFLRGLLLIGSSFATDPIGLLKKIRIIKGGDDEPKSR